MSLLIYITDTILSYSNKITYNQTMVLNFPSPELIGWKQLATFSFKTFDILLIIYLLRAFIYSQTDILAWVLGGVWFGSRVWTKTQTHTHTQRPKYILDPDSNPNPKTQIFLSPDPNETQI